MALTACRRRDAPLHEGVTVSKAEPNFFLLAHWSRVQTQGVERADPVLDSQVKKLALAQSYPPVIACRRIFILCAAAREGLFLIF